MSTINTEVKTESDEVVKGFNQEEKSNLMEHIEHLSYKLQNLKDILDVVAIWLETEGETMSSNAVSAGSDSLEMILKVHVEPIKDYFFLSKAEVNKLMNELDA